MCAMAGWLEQLAGRFIVFDGPDGSGKTTQFRRFADHCRAAGVSVCEVREPGGTVIGEQIRNVLLDPAHDTMSVRCEMMLYMASRAQLMEEKVKPALQRTKLLVKSNHRNFIVDAQDMVYATIEDGLITIVATALEGQSNYRTIEELQSNLDPDTFWRVHRSYLVNIHRIKEVIPWFKSSFQLRMDDKKQTEIPVSRVQTKRLRALLKL